MSSHAIEAAAGQSKNRIIHRQQLMDFRQFCGVRWSGIAAMPSFQWDGDHTLIFGAYKELSGVRQQRSGKNPISQRAGKTSALKHRDAEYGADECCVS